MAKISDTELRFIINNEINNALGFMGENYPTKEKNLLNII
jgi:hypothetical protein